MITNRHILHNKIPKIIKLHFSHNKSIGGFTVNKTDKRLNKLYGWFFGDFD